MYDPSLDLNLDRLVREARALHSDFEILDNLVCKLRGSGAAAEVAGPVAVVRDRLDHRALDRLRRLRSATCWRCAPERLS